MDAAKLRAFWAAQQGLDGSLHDADPAGVLARSGWARSVGGAGPYLTLFSRAGTSREAADRAVSNLAIHEIPAARGCTYVVPASDFALALHAGQEFGKAEVKTAAKLGVKAAEIERLCEAVSKAVAKTPLDPDDIRAAVGSAARSLGEAGKKKGLSTTLPVALGLLQSRGEIRRVPTNGRLDQQRYLYVGWKPSPLAKSKMSSEEAYVELARRFFHWVGPATIAEFRWFSGLGAKASLAATAPWGLVPIEPGSDRLVFPDDLERFKSFKVPAKPHYVFVGSLDAISATRRDVLGLLDDGDAKRKVFVDKGSHPLNGLNDLPNHAILDRGRLVGLWEFDVDTQSIAWVSFVPKDKVLQKAARDAEAFVRDQLGDARSFSLDSPKSRSPRIAALRKMK